MSTRNSAFEPKQTITSVNYLLKTAVRIVDRLRSNNKHTSCRSIINIKDLEFAVVLGSFIVIEMVYFAVLITKNGKEVGFDTSPNCNQIRHLDDCLVGLEVVVGTVIYLGDRSPHDVHH